MDILKISEIKSNPNNPRVIKDDKFKKLVQSIKDFPRMLELRPLVLDENNIVLGGNMRLKACISLGLKEVPVVYAKDLTEEQKKEFIIKDNVGFGEWDWDVLANEWESTQLNEWGLDVPEIETIDPEVTEDDYEMPDEVKTDIVLGDLIEIGEHRLLCGDSTSIDAVEKLMNGEKADMVFTDPPYGMRLQAAYKWSKGNKDKGIKPSKGYDNVIGDDKDFDPSFFIEIFSYCKEQFWWGADYYVDKLPNCGKDGAWHVWDKKNDDLNKVWTNAHELLWSMQPHRRKVVRVLWNGALGTESEDTKNRVHPTQKPVRVYSPYIEEYSKDGTLLVDLFLGSGSTMVASHQLKRKCYGMELDPKYCQVIVDRMKKLDPSLVIKRNGELWIK